MSSNDVFLSFMKKGGTRTYQSDIENSRPHRDHSLRNIQTNEVRRYGLIRVHT